MGLDAYGKTRNPKTGEVDQIAYWRKHNALHGWMETKWRERGGTGDFNGVPLELTLEDLEELEKEVKNNSLPETQGFFFGPDSRGDEYQDELTLEFIQEAREAIKDGFDVAYDSWW